MFDEGIEKTAEYLIENFEFDSWYAVLMSFSIWTLLYFTIRAALLNQSPEYCSRILTLIHGMIMTFHGLNQCFGYKSPFDNPQEPTTSLQAFILVTSLGYFLEDLSWCLYHKTETKLMIAHHIYSCYALSRMLFKGFAGRQAACGLGALEVTNPLLQMRWFIRSHGYHDTSLFTAVEVTFIITFFIVRIILGTFYLIVILTEKKNSLEFKILSGVIYIMSWMFMINISKYFVHKYLKDNVRMEAELGHISTS